MGRRFRVSALPPVRRAAPDGGGLRRRGEGHILPSRGEHHLRGKSQGLGAGARNRAAAQRPGAGEPIGGGPGTILNPGGNNRGARGENGLNRKALGGVESPEFSRGTQRASLPIKKLRGAINPMQWKTVLPSFTAILISTVGMGTVPALAGPKAEIVPLQLELGTIDEGGSYERFVEVKNVGDGVLILEDVKTSCGCTAAAVDGVSELKAGQSQKVKVTFNSKGMEGAIKKMVHIMTNDPEHKDVEVTLVADVHVPVRFEPKSITLDSINPKNGAERKITLMADPDLKLEVKEAKALGGRTMNQPSELFEVTHSEKKVVENKDRYDFVVKLRPGAKPQKVNESLLVLTNLGPGRDSLKVRIFGDLVGRLSFNVQYGVIPQTETGAEAVRDVEVLAKEGTFKVLKAEVPDSPVKVEIIPDPAGTKTTLRLKYVGEQPGTNGIRTLHVETDDPDQKFLEVPVRYQTSAAKTKAATGAGAGAGGSKGEPKASERD